MAIIILSVCIVIITDGSKYFLQKIGIILNFAPKPLSIVEICSILLYFDNNLIY